MLITKIIALVALVSWLGTTGERLYSYLAGGESVSAQTKEGDRSQTARWAVSELRW